MSIHEPTILDALDLVRLMGTAVRHQSGLLDGAERRITEGRPADARAQIGQARHEGREIVGLVEQCIDKLQRACQEGRHDGLLDYGEAEERLSRSLRERQRADGVA